MADISKLEQRMTDLEMRLSFQDATIEALNGVVTSQQQELATLTSQLKKVREQLLDAGFVDSSPVKPPHY